MFKWETLPFGYKVSRAISAFGVLTVIGALIYAGVYKIIPSLFLVAFGMACCLLFGIGLSITPEDRAAMDEVQKKFVEVLAKFKGAEEVARALAGERDDLLTQVGAQKVTLKEMQKEMDSLSSTLESLKAKPAPKTPPAPEKEPEANKELPKGKKEEEKKVETKADPDKKKEPEVINRKGAPPSPPPAG